MTSSKRLSRNSIVTAFAIFCILGAFYYSPLSPFPNDLTVPAPPIYAFARLPLPYNLTQPEKNGTAIMYIELTTKTDFIVGEPLNFSTTLIVPASAKNNYLAGVIVTPDDSLYYPIYPIPNMEATAAFGFLPLFLTKQLPKSTLWSGWQMIEYTVTGSFGLTINFSNITYVYVPSLGKNLVFNVVVAQIHTDPLFSIGSRDSLITKRNAGTTTMLTFLVLCLAALPLRKEDRIDTQETGRKSTVPKKSTKTRRGKATSKQT